MADITGLSHLTLTVSDLDRSVQWWTDLLGLQKLFDGEESGMRFSVTVHPGSNLIIGFRQHEEAGPDRFSEDRVGLDHAAFEVATRAELEEWDTLLEEKNIDHSEIKDAGYGSVITFRDPDNIQLEFFALPDAAPTV
ncbi:MAG: VOC family protein [Actinomycetota bacterium]|nr:VOC family protein [Actinomycetota bacterium]